MKILFFASIRERLGVDDESWEDAAHCKTIADVLDRLSARGGVWQEVLSDSRVMVALNQEVTSVDAAVQPGDEIGIFPPVTGG